jgi:predicted dehydrogenase
MTRVGIIGTGFARRVQLPALRLVSGTEVVAIASGHRANADAVAREFAIPCVFDDGVALAVAEGIDLVIVSSPPDSHEHYAIAALEAGKHVLCEKPMARDAGEAARMLATAERRPAQLAWMDHELRYEPNRRKARDLIRAGAIGQLRHIEFSLKPYRRGDGRPQATTAPWGWWYDATRGGGLLGAVGSHLIDLCRYWSGSDVTGVGGGVATFGPPRADETGVVRPATSDDFASFVLRLANGCVATYTLSAAAHHGPGHLAQVTGSEGTIVLTGEVGLQMGRTGGPLEDITPPDDLWDRLPVNNMWSRSFVRLMRDMVRVIDGAKPEDIPATFRDGWEVQKVMDAVRR